MMRWHFLILTPLLLLKVWQPETEHVYYTDSGHAEFTSSVPLHTFTGKSDHLTGMIDFESNVVDFYLDLETLKTGNRRRDHDVYHRTLNVEEYPFAEFTGSLDIPFDTTSLESQIVTVTGNFSIHGVTQNRMVEGTLQKVDGGFQLNSEWTLNITDYEIKPPGILFYRVDEEMDVRVEALLLPREMEQEQEME